VRVNLIHSILVFWEKNIVYMTMQVNLIHSKLVSFKKNTKTKHTGKKRFTRTVQVNCTVHINTEFLKAAMSCFVKFTCKKQICMRPIKIKLHFFR